MSRSSPQILDVRPIQTRRIPLVVRAAVERLPAGASMVVVCTCDPGWVGRTVAQRTDGTVSWQTIEEAGEEVHIRITREA